MQVGTFISVQVCHQGGDGRRIQEKKSPAHSGESTWGPGLRSLLHPFTHTSKLLRVATPKRVRRVGGGPSEDTWDTHPSRNRGVA